MKGIKLVVHTLCLFLYYTDTFALADVFDTKPLIATEELQKNDLADVIRRINHLESSDNDMKNENRKLQEEVTSLKTYISTLAAESEKTVSDLQSQITDLQAKNLQNELIIQSLVSTVKTDTSGQKSSLPSETIVMKNETLHLMKGGSPGTYKATEEEDLTEDLEKEVKINRELHDASQIQKRFLDSDEKRIVRRENEVRVAFYATVGEHHIEHAGANQTIVFDNVITNLGNAYSKYAGDFRAPVAGTYVFSVTLMAYNAHTTHDRITKNGAGIGNIYLRGQDGAYTTSALTAVLELKQGDNVSIRNIDPDEYLYGYAYSAFSGFLLQQDFSNQAIVGK